MGFITYIIILKGGDIMSQHLLSVIFTLVYYLFLIYLIFIEISYTYLKHIKKDCRFENVGFFKYLESPIKTLKGDK